MPNHLQQSTMNVTASILIVDDEEDIRRLLAMALQRAGFTVSTASGGSEALEALRAGAYDLVVTDLRMPGMSGLDLLRRVAECRPLTKGIVLTGFGSIESAVEATKLGADNYLTKPIVIDELLRTVRHTLERGQPLRAAAGTALEVTALAALTRVLVHPTADLQQTAQGAADVVSSMLRAQTRLRIISGQTGQEALRAEGGGRSSFQDDSGAAHGPGTYALTAVLLTASRHGYTGLIEASRTLEALPFSKEEAQLLQVAANQISIALDNSLTGRSLASTQRELRQVSLQTVQALVRAVEMRDRYTAGHSARVARYAVALAKSLDLAANEIENLRIAALLHDVGKVGISDLLLNKPGPLTPEEWAIIQQHPAMGCRIVEGVQSLSPSVPLIMHHQERYDGLGYPDGLRGEQIPYGARILAIADSFEAITATRAYRRGRSTDEAVAILNAGAGEQWDALMVSRWRQIVSSILAEQAGDPPTPQETANAL